MHPKTGPTENRAVAAVNKAKHTYAMTLRLDEQMADSVEDVAFSLNLSQAAFIRRSILRAIRHAHQFELPGSTEGVEGTNK
jgi:hypothetical protein